MEGYTPPKATVVEGSPVRKKASPARRLHKKLNNKFVWIVIAVVIVGLIGGLKLNQVLLVRGGCAGQAKSPVYDEAAKVMDPKKLDQFKLFAEKVQKKRGYDKDVNCMYPVAMYYIYTEDVKSAEQTIAKMQKVYRPDLGIAQVYRARAYSFTALKNQLQATKKITTDDAKQMPGFFN